MTTKNSNSLQSWNWESSVQTPTITTASSTSYFFGQDDGKKIEAPQIANSVATSYNSASRLVDQSKPSRNFKDFKIGYYPTQPLGIFRLLGVITAPHDAIVDWVITPKHTGTKKSFTHRWQQSGGTNPQVINACGCFTTEIYYEGSCGKNATPLQCMETITWGKIEDQNTRDPLTTLPTHPESIEECYEGTPQVKICDSSTGIEVITLSEVFQADIDIKQNYAAVKSQDGLTQSIYLGAYDPITVHILAVFEQNQQWDDLMAKTERIVTIRFVKKNDALKYLEFTLKGYFINAVRSGQKVDNYYGEIFTFQANTIQVNFVYEGNALSTYYPN